MTLSDVYIKLSEVIFDVGQKYKDANLTPDLPNLTLKQYYYLDVINRMNNPTYSEIANNFKVTKPAITAIINRLIKLGYLERVQSANDRRVYYVLVSDKGKKLIGINNESASAYAKYVENCLTREELASYINILEKVIVTYTTRKV
jgi:DNA-binding MarR family transcriptional regulator